MKAIPWSVVALILGVLGAVTFLVWDGKLDAEVLTALVSALTGGGLLHLGRTSTGTTPS